MSSHAEEVRAGERFEFGKNWKNFVRVLDDGRIAEAEKSLREMLGVQRLDGLTFLDIGSGSGLFSMVARRLGAKVHSLDYDPDSVECTRQMKAKYFPDDPDWTIQEASVLDAAVMDALPEFDIVYSWGVLMVTGDMWRGLENAARRVKIGGKLFIAIYNDQGGASERWLIIKRAYMGAGKIGRLAIVGAVGAFFEARSALIRLIRLQNPLPFKYWQQKRKERGMTVWYDLIDWVGGYPCEFATPEEVFNFCRDRGFQLQVLKTVGGGLGCNEFVLERTSRPSEVSRPALQTESAN